MGTYNRHVKLGLKIPNRSGKMSENFRGGIFLTHCSYKLLVAMTGTWFLPATTAIGAGLYSVAMYGGLVLFGGFLLYDTQKIIYRAENHPVYAMQPYDPINK